MLATLIMFTVRFYIIFPTNLSPSEQPTITVAPPVNETMEGDTITVGVTIIFSVPIGTIHTVTAG